MEAVVNILEYRSLVEAIARSTANLSKQLDAEDIAQHIYMTWLERWDDLSKYLPDEQRHALVASLRNMAMDYVRRELRHSAQPDDIYYYSRDQLRLILPLVENAEAWSSFASKQEKSGGTVKADPALGNNALAMYSDLRAAWEALPDDQRGLLRARFVEGLEYAQLAVILDQSEVTVRKAVERALTVVQRFLGGRSRQDAPQRRRAMTRAASEVATRSAYDGA